METALPGYAIRRTIGCLIAAVSLCAVRPAYAQLNPVNTGATLTSLSFSWSGAAVPYTMALSTADDFSVLTATGSLSATATTYVNLSQNGRYYFKVKPTADTDAAYEAITPASTSTLAAAPSGVYFNSDDFQSSILYSKVTIGWANNNNPAATVYQVDYSLNDAFLAAETTTTSRSHQPQAGDIGGLAANTTYYFRVRALSLAGNPTASAEASTATLAITPSGINSAVHETSATVSWNPVSNLAQALDSEGYRLLIATSANLEPVIQQWNTDDHDISSVDLSGLDRNTTYYYRIGTLNWYGAINSDYTRTFTTLTSTTQLAIINVATRTATIGWVALPQGPSTATSMGYTLEASSTGFNGTGAYLSTTTYDVTDTTLTISGLDANTTYYFRVGPLNQDFKPNYSAALSSITLTVPLTNDLLNTGAAHSSLTVTLNPPLQSSPQSYSCEGYLLEGSSQPFGGGSLMHSSASYTNLTNSLTLEGLRPNTTYYLRIATLNWTKTPNFTVMPQAGTTLGGALPVVPLADIMESSVTINFSPIDSDGYIFQASRFSHFSPVFSSSSTADPDAASLAVSGLDENTIYYFRTGTLYNGSTIYTLTAPDSASTLAKPLTAQAITAVFYTSATVSWTPLPTGPEQKDTAEYYKLQASTSSDFAAISRSSHSLGVTDTRLTVKDLLPNTSYYLRAGTINWHDAGNFVYTPATSTLASPPVQPQDLQTAFTGLTTGQMTVNWLTGDNPPDTLYSVRLSSNPGFTDPVHSSDTFNSGASFTDLVPNTTYYPEVTAINRLNVPEGPYEFAPMSTMAFDPVAQAYSGVGSSSITLNWGRGDNPAGGTYYRAEISSNPAFSGTVLSSVTLAYSATFHGLVPNATYYLQVSALNHTGVRTDPETGLGATLTLPTTPYIFAKADTFFGLITDGFSIRWADNGNSSHTIYNLEISTAEDFNAGAGGRNITTMDFAYTFMDLSVGTTYWARIRSIGQGGAATDFAAAWSTGTLLTGQVGAVATRDNTITLQTSYGLISVFFPYGSLGGSTRISIKPLSVFMPAASAVSVLRPTGIGLEISRSPQVLILNPVTITLPYRFSDIPAGMDRNKLVLALYDEAGGVWVPLPSVSDLTNNKVIAQTWHLSTFQLMEAVSAGDLGSAKIYPNPYTPSRISDVMHFTNMPPYAKVKIYTFLGELVKEFAADINGMAYWDGKNSSGQKAASAVYIALLQTRDKKSSKIVKVVVER